MNKAFVYLIIFLLFIACGENKQEELRNLTARRDALNRKIEQLKAEIQAKGDTLEVTNLEYVTVKKITPRKHNHFIKLQGMVESDHNIFVPAQSSGVVKKIHVTKGERVREAQLLAELDGAILKNTLAEIEVNLELARTVYERQKRLWEKNIGSEIQYLQAKTNLEALEKRKAAADEQYRLTRILSPINGRVDGIVIKEGEAVAAGFGAIRVVENSKMKITADLSEEYSGNVKEGDSVMVTVPVPAISFSSKIRSVARAIDPKNRTFTLEIAVPAKVSGIQPNMLAVLEISDYSNPEALVIPINIRQKSGEKPFIFVAAPDENTRSDIWTVYRRSITTDWPTADEAEVTDGLEAGEYVVISGYQDLGDGQRVRVHEQPVL